MRKWRPDGRRRTFGLVEGYEPPEGVADELLKPDGSLRPVWTPLINHLSQLPPDALAQRFARFPLDEQLPAGAPRRIIPLF